jgi:hypothetical protein
MSWLEDNFDDLLEGLLKYGRVTFGTHVGGGYQNISWHFSLDEMHVRCFDVFSAKIDLHDPNSIPLLGSAFKFCRVKADCVGCPITTRPRR